MALCTKYTPSPPPLGARSVVLTRDIFDSRGRCLEKGELISPPNFFWDGKILCLVDFSPFLCSKDRLMRPLFYFFSSFVNT